MGRHYNRTKKSGSVFNLGNDHAKRDRQKDERDSDRTDVKLAKEYGVSAITVYRNAQFAAADTLRSVDPPSRPDAP